MCLLPDTEQWMLCNDRALFWLPEDSVNLLISGSHLSLSQDLKLIHLYNVDILNINRYSLRPIKILSWSTYQIFTHDEVSEIPLDIFSPFCIPGFLYFDLPIHFLCFFNRNLSDLTPDPINQNLPMGYSHSYILKASLII